MSYTPDDLLTPTITPDLLKLIRRCTLRRCDSAHPDGPVGRLDEGGQGGASYALAIVSPAPGLAVFRAVESSVGGYSSVLLSEAAYDILVHGEQEAPAIWRKKGGTGRCRLVVRFAGRLAYLGVVWLGAPGQT